MSPPLRCWPNIKQTFIPGLVFVVLVAAWFKQPSLCNKVISQRGDPTDTIHWPNAGWMLARCLRRRSNVHPALGQCIVMAGNGAFVHWSIGHHNTLPSSTDQSKTNHTPLLLLQGIESFPRIVLQKTTEGSLYWFLAHSMLDCRPESLLISLSCLPKWLRNN